MSSSDATKNVLEDGKPTASIPVGNPSTTIGPGGSAAGSSGAASVHNKLEQDYIQMYLG